MQLAGLRRNDMTELVLTGDARFWPTTPEDAQAAVYLAPWCFLGRPNLAFSDQTKFQILPSPYDSWTAVSRRIEYLEELYDRLADSLARTLNEANETEYSGRYWRIRLGVWLLHYLHSAYDQYLRIEAAANDGREFQVRILESKGPAACARLSDYFQALASHEYNLERMAALLQDWRPDNLQLSIEKASEGRAPGIESEIAKSLSADLPARKPRRLEFLRRVYRRWRDPWLLARSADLVIGKDCGWAPSDYAYFVSRLDPGAWWRSDAPTAAARPFDHGVREESLKEFRAENPFEDHLQRRLMRQVPAEVLAYGRLGDESEDGTSCRRLFIGNEIYADEPARLEIARAVSGQAAGGLLGMQHGGGYGHFACFPLGKLEYEIPDRFITWGWDYPHDDYEGPFTALPSPHLEYLKRAVRMQRSAASGLLFVGTMHPGYYYRLHSTLRPEQHLPYLENRRIFFEALTSQWRDSARFKPYMNEYGQDEVGFMRRFLTEDQVLGIESRALQDAPQYEVVVVDHMATTFMQLFVLNIPTIIFWDPEHFAAGAVAQKDFDELAAVGIFHTTPQAAADHLNGLADVGEWWHSADVQTVLDRFRFKYARTETGYRRQWLRFLKAQLKHIRNGNALA